MENRAIEIRSSANSAVRIKCIPGHFATNHSHINYYVDLTQLKTGLNDAKLVGDLFAESYLATQVDTIICMDDTQLIAAFLAQKLVSARNAVNFNQNINVLTPEYNSNGQMIFRDNTQKMIWQKKVLLLIASATTGKTIERSLDCINYYGGEAVGVAAVFSATDTIADFNIVSIFSDADVPGYASYFPKDCPACKSKNKLDAIVNAYGYSKI